MRRALATLALVLLAAPAEGEAATVPAIRTGGPTLVVCRPDSAAHIRRIWPGRGPRTTRSRRARLRLVGRCGYRDVQAAVDAATDGTRILVLPGAYRGRVHLTGRSGVQLQGTGLWAKDVVLEGDVRAERADGVAIVNLTAERGAIAVADTDGFRLQKLVARLSRDDGVAAVRSDHGLVEAVEAYGNGRSGIAVAATAGCRGPGIEVRRVLAYRNVLGISAAGAAVRDSRFVDNAAGASPAGCSLWEGNVIASNNRDPYGTEPCSGICPRRAVPVGSGFVLYGANRNTVRGNAIYDNWRSGVRLFWVPASARGVRDPALQFDTSNANRFVANRMGPRPNGIDVVWDEEGAGNCWSGNTGPGGAPPTSDPVALPACPRGNPLSTGDAVKQALEVPCAAWDPRANPDPVGCSWLSTPPRPR